MLYYVDRIEGGFALCQTPDGKIVSILLDKLPDQTKAGSVLCETDGVFTLDAAATEARRAALFDLQESLFEEEEPSANA